MKKRERRILESAERLRQANRAAGEAHDALVAARARQSECHDAVRVAEDAKERAQWAAAAAQRDLLDVAAGGARP